MPICAICGNDVERSTTDHIPPKNLFATRPCNPITMPACDDCNGGSSKDDEYFRLLASEVDTSSHPEAKKINEKIVRPLEREQAAGFREGLRKAIYPIQVETDGIKEVKPLFGLEVERLDRIAVKVTRGLFYHTRGYPVPKNYKVLTANIDLFMEKPVSVDLAKLIVNYLLPKISWVKPTVLGDNVFIYQTYHDDDDVNTVFVLMQFYQKWRWFGLVLESATDEPTKG